MTDDPHALPPGFESLLPFVAAWAAPSAAARAALRATSCEADRRAFYDAAKPLLSAALAHLDQKPLHGLDASEHRLLALMLSLAHVSLAVEVQAADEAKHAQSARHLRIVREASDA